VLQLITGNTPELIKTNFKLPSTKKKMKSALVRYLGTHVEGPKWNFCGLSMESRGVFQSAHPVQERFEFEARNSRLISKA
jgi:hypothetical protein